MDCFQEILYSFQIVCWQETREINPSVANLQPLKIPENLQGILNAFSEYKMCPLAKIGSRQHCRTKYLGAKVSSANNRFG